MKISYNFLMRGYDIFVDDKEIYEGRCNVNYYELPKDKRWLESDSPYEIGGRATDITQIAYSLTARVREMYPINKVPEDIVTQLDTLTGLCKKCEDEIEKTIGLISKKREEVVK